jgi:hypothetical protein
MISVELKEGQHLYDNEGRHVAESYGFHVFAWLPQQCRNGKIRWLTWLERHNDGTHTLGRGG